MSIVHFGHDNPELPQTDAEWLESIVQAVKGSSLFEPLGPRTAGDAFLVQLILLRDNPQRADPNWNPVQGKVED